MYHSFNVEIAKNIGMKEAILLNFISNDITDNAIDNVNFYNGKYWCARSVDSIAKKLPYMTKSSIRKALSTLETKGFIISGFYGEDIFDRTKWYAIGEACKEYA